MKQEQGDTPDNILAVLCLIIGGPLLAANIIVALPRITDTLGYTGVAETQTYTVQAPRLTR